MLDLAGREWSLRLPDLVQAWLMVSEAYVRHAARPFRLDAATLRRNDDPPDYTAFREAAINLLIHQDYGDRNRTAFIRSFRDRTVFWNPGDAFATTGELLDATAKHLRNPAIVTAFRRIGLSEQAGTGMRAIFRNWHSLGHVPPVIENDKARKAFELRLLRQELLGSEQRQLQVLLGARLDERQGPGLCVRLPERAGFADGRQGGHRRDGAGGSDGARHARGAGAAAASGRRAALPLDRTCRGSARRVSTGAVPKRPCPGRSCRHGRRRPDRADTWIRRHVRCTCPLQERRHVHVGAYYAGRSVAYALRISKVWEYDEPVHLEVLRRHFSDFVTPQSWRYVKADESRYFQTLRRSPIRQRVGSGTAGSGNRARERDRDGSTGRATHANRRATPLAADRTG